MPPATIDGNTFAVAVGPALLTTMLYGPVPLNVPFESVATNVTENWNVPTVVGFPEI
jgi:hypothetical protein